MNMTPKQRKSIYTMIEANTKVAPVVLEGFSIEEILTIKVGRSNLELPPSIKVEELPQEIILQIFNHPNFYHIILNHQSIWSTFPEYLVEGKFEDYFSNGGFQTRFYHLERLPDYLFISDSNYMEYRSANDERDYRLIRLLLKSYGHREWFLKELVSSSSDEVVERAFNGIDIVDISLPISVFLAIPFKLIKKMKYLDYIKFLIKKFGTGVSQSNNDLTLVLTRIGPLLTTKQLISILSLIKSKNIDEPRKFMAKMYKSLNLPKDFKDFLIGLKGPHDLIYFGDENFIEFLTNHSKDFLGEEEASRLIVLSADNYFQRRGSFYYNHHVLIKLFDLDLISEKDIRRYMRMDIVSFTRSYNRHRMYASCNYFDILLDEIKKEINPR